MGASSQCFQLDKIFTVWCVRADIYTTWINICVCARACERIGLSSRTHEIHTHKIHFQLQDETSPAAIRGAKRHSA